MKKRDRFTEVAERVVLAASLVWYLWSFLLIAVWLS